MRRSALAALLLANVAVFTYVVGYLDERGPVWRYAPLIAAALLLVLAIKPIVRSFKIEREPVVAEMLDQPGSIIRVTSGDKLVRVILRSGNEHIFMVDAQDRKKLLDALAQHAPGADFVSHV